MQQVRSALQRDNVPPLSHVVLRAAAGHISGGQDGEQKKQKSYLARCRLPCPVTAQHLEQLNATQDLLLQQKTPTRVEHRRAMLVRSLVTLFT